MKLDYKNRGPRFTLNMSFSHAEFLRPLPAALDGKDFTRDDGPRIVVSESGGRRVTIDLGPEQRRQIALIGIVNTDVHFSFEGYDGDAIDAFMNAFMARYQRGGG